MNTELAAEVAVKVREGEHWSQEAWWSGTGWPGATPVSDLLEGKCGTTGCVAGWTVAIAHPRAVFSGYSGIRLTPERDKAGTVHGISIAGTASNDLELTAFQADWLFSASRSRFEVLWALENDNPCWMPGECPGYDDE